MTEITGWDRLCILFLKSMKMKGWIFYVLEAYF
jgi:hypothetical protein